MLAKIGPEYNDNICAVTLCHPSRENFVNFTQIQGYVSQIEYELITLILWKHFPGNFHFNGAYFLIVTHYGKPAVRVCGK